jgi:hypothetical protein
LALEKPAKGPGLSLKSGEAVPKTEVLEQPRLVTLFNHSAIPNFFFVL